MLVASFLGLFAGLALLVVLTMRGVNIIISAVLCAMLVAVCSGLPLSDAMLDSYMAGFTGFFTSWFPAILLGALFGQLMDDSGAAKAIARQSSRWFGEKRAIMAVVGASAILTYGGVSVFVVGFSVYPIALPVDRSRSSARFGSSASVKASASMAARSWCSPRTSRNDRPMCPGSASRPRMRYAAPFTTAIDPSRQIPITPLRRLWTTFW